MLHVLTGDDRREGFGECLRQRREAREFVKATKFENVSLISAGIDGSPSCLLDSFELDFFIDQMREIADWVLFDTPPINVSNDALALASKVDGVVLVLRAEKTRWEVAQHAVERLEGAGANVVGVILNRRRMPIPDWLYRRL
jgi:Mrp family chromosome partitioning ATPase